MAGGTVLQAGAPKAGAVDGEGAVARIGVRLPLLLLAHLLLPSGEELVNAPEP